MMGYLKKIKMKTWCEALGGRIEMSRVKIHYMKFSKNTIFKKKENTESGTLNLSP